MQTQETAEERIAKNLRTEIIDPKTKTVIGTRYYRRHCSKSGGVVYERDGIFYTEAWEEIPSAQWDKMKVNFPITAKKK